MTNALAVRSPTREHDVGRKPSENPKSIHLGIRIDEDTARALDAEIERLRRSESLDLGRSDIVRKLIAEALAVRPKRVK